MWNPQIYFSLLDLRNIFNLCLESTINARKGSYATLKWGTGQERNRLPTESSAGGQGGSCRVPSQFSVIQRCFLDILLGTAICSRQGLIFICLNKLVVTSQIFQNSFQIPEYVFKLSFSIFWIMNIHLLYVPGYIVFWFFFTSCIVLASSSFTHVAMSIYRQ